MCVSADERQQSMSAVTTLESTTSSASGQQTTCTGGACRTECHTSTAFLQVVDVTCQRDVVLSTALNADDGNQVYN